MNRATTYELECFVAVAEELNFSRAASRLHLSQPPLSRQIQSLEAKLGVRLLNRDTRAVSLTAAGELYLDDARQVLLRVDGAAAVARRAAKGEISRLRLSFVGVLLDEALVMILRAFRQAHPRCQIHLSDLPPGEQLKQLQAGELDGAFIGAAPRKTGRGISTLIWKREPLLLALPESHPIARARSVSFADVEPENWVMVSRVAAPAFRKQFDQLCANTSIHARIVQESERAVAVLTMVAAEQGISLLPESMSRLIHPGVVFRPVKGETLTLNHAFAYRSRKTSAPVAELLKLLVRHSGKF